MLTKRRLLSSAALAGVATAATRLSPVRAQTSTPRPGFIAAKDIAEAGLIFGLPIVMNYGVMYEYAVDRNSGQFKAPFNQLKNEPNVFTYKDTSIPTPNSDTPYSFAWMDLRAEPIVISVPAVDPKRYYSVMLCDGNTYNYDYIGTVLSVFAPLSWASFGLRHLHSSCCQDSEDNRGFPHMSPAPHCGGNMLAHMGSAS
jgi:hypothetical protein